MTTHRTVSPNAASISSSPRDVAHTPRRRGLRNTLSTLAFGALAATVACDATDLTSPPRFSDPVSAVVSNGETLATVHWNGITQSLIGTNKPNQNAAWRTLAYVTLAQHVALEELVTRNGVTRSMMRGAVAGASARVLIYSYPSDSANVEAAVRAEENAAPPGQREAFRYAEQIGRTIGDKVVARARQDRFGAVWTGEVPVGPGKWFSLSATPAPPLLPLGGNVAPFFLRVGSQFRPSAPPAWQSPAFLDALAEVRRISDSRTPTQDSLARFWALPTGGLVVGYWNTTAINLITSARTGERGAAHALALMNTAGFDALTACHDAKYTYWLIRPSGADGAIKPPIGVPNHPSYPSNHACLSGTSAFILGSIFPASRETLQGKAYEAGMSRVYGGIHFRFDSDAGMEIARKVSAYALDLDRGGHLTRLIQP